MTLIILNLKLLKGLKVKNTDYTKGTLRTKEQETKTHWMWEVVGFMLALVAMSQVAIWIAEALV
jgi:hypothetical protein